VNATKPAKLPRRLVPVAAAALLLAVPALSSCGVNFDAQTDQYYTPADGVSNREGTVDVLNAMIISNDAGSGRLVAALANGDTEEADTLTGVRGIEEDEDVQVQLVGGDTAIPAGGVLQLADQDAAVVMVTGDPEKVKPGTFVRLAFMFQNGEEADVNVPVLDAGEPGETYGDIEIPSPSSSSTPDAQG
jgi:hypothetical protein